jgi:hypothetical protein
MHQVTISPNLFAITVLAMPIALSCSAPPIAQRAGPGHHNDRGSDAEAQLPAMASSTPSSSDADASIASDDAGTATDGGVSFLPWPEADACTFPAVSPAEGTTAKQCCHPASSVTVCLETKSLIHHHAVGPYTERTLTVSHVSNAQSPWSFPLDRRRHGSMKYPDVVMARLSFRVHQGGLELRVRAGCQNVCTSERCGKEEKLLATICTSAGKYGWDGERLVPE